MYRNINNANIDIGDTEFGNINMDFGDINIPAPQTFIANINIHDIDTDICVIDAGIGHNDIPVP